MKIDRVTITGPDDNTNIDDLIALSEKYPFVEWGILFSQKNGRQRYPSDEWITKLLLNQTGMKLSAHFCGWYPRQVLEHANYELINNLVGFMRVQLNYNFKRSKGWDLGRLLSTFDKRSYDNINYKDIILQYNKSNADIIENADIPDKFNILFDASGGRGTEISEIRPPVKGLYTGYAGGLNVSNVENICRVIGEVDDNSRVWIDLESGARTDNEFDLDKVEKILEITNRCI